MLTLENITKTYFIGNEQVKVIDNLTITFPEKGFIGIKGESGCGKSTLLNIISTLEKADGEIKYNNQKVDENFLKKHISIVSQNHDLISSLTVKENIMIGAKIAEVKYSKQLFKKIVKKLELELLLSFYPYQLSGGQQRRASIARGLLKDASILLCDEPTGALHFSQAIEVMELLKEESKERLVIIVSHDDMLLNEYCDDILILENGKFDKELEIKEAYEIKKSENKKYSLLFYIISQLKAQKFSLMFLVFFQMIIITSLVLILTTINGIEYELNKQYQQAPLKNVLTLEKYDNSLFKELPTIKNANVNYEYILSLGELSEDVYMNMLPEDTSHIILESGRLPTNHNEMIITSTLKNKIKKLSYTTSSLNIDLNVVGVLDEDFFKEEAIYVHNSFYKLIPEFKNQGIVIVESQNIEELYQSLSDNYIVYSDPIESRDSYKSLLEMGKMISLIFFVISFICSFFLLYIVYSTIGERRKRDSALLLMMGLSQKDLFFIFILESLLIGMLIGITGVLMSVVIVYYVNSVLNIYQLYSFSLKLNSYIFTSYDLYIFILFIYLFLSAISAYLPAKKIKNSQLVSILREE